MVKRLLGAGALALALTGCATQAHYNSNAVDFLFPEKTKLVKSSTVPVMALPLKVGIAFLPESRAQRARTPWKTFMGSLASDKAPPTVLTERQKTELMQKVAGYFANYYFISGVEMIPSAYLRPGGSFDNLDQIRAIYGVDVIVLLGYDQMQFTDQNAASLLYLTVVGAYVVKGEKNTTQTMMDAVVYDIESRKMLFRAPGVSYVKGSATPINQSEELWRNSAEGFRTASVDLILNLDDKLTRFREQVRKDPGRYGVVLQPR